MICRLCPRNCGALRTETEGSGVCAMPAAPVVARAALHEWEEPCISGWNGSGAVFFSGCPLGCVFCQNGKISRENFGESVSVARLREIFLELKAQGAHNINLVSPTQFAPWIAQALEEPVGLSVVWNSGGYDTVETLRSMEGKVQIYLPDLKYARTEPAEKYSRAADYFPMAAKAIEEMFRQTGPYRMNDDGLLESGVLIRHLMLPGELENTKAVIDWVSARFSPGDVLFSLMNQYTPQPGAEGLLRRRVSGAEYRAAEQYLENCGIAEGYLQSGASAEARFTPPFDLRGVFQSEAAEAAKTEQQGERT